MNIDLDDLRRRADTLTKTDPKYPDHHARATFEFHSAWTPEVCLWMLDSIRTLMDKDSILAASQRVSKQAIEDMIQARKERDEARAEVEMLRKRLAEAWG